MATASRKKVDRVFAAIKWHRKAEDDFLEGLRVVLPDTGDPDPKVEKRLGSRERRARERLVKTAPSTLSGVLALVRYAIERSLPLDPLFDSEEALRVLENMARAIEAHLSANPEAPR